MGDFYSPVTGFHYGSKEQKEAMEKKYMADLENKKLKELQKANQIQQQNEFLKQQEQQEQQRQARENARIMAEATRQAEKDRYNNELEMEKMRQEHDKKMRFYRLCDDFGIDYEDIYQFELWLKLLSKKTIQEYQNTLEEVKELVETDEVKNIYTKADETENKLQNIENELEQLKNISIPGVKNNGVEVSETKEKIEELIDENNKLIPSVRNYLIGITIITLIIFGFTIDTFGVAVLIIGGILDLIFLDRLLRLKNGSKLAKEAVNDAKDKEKRLLEEKKKYEKQLSKEKEEIDQLTKFNFQQLENDKKYGNLLERYEKAMSFAQEGYTPNQEEFYTFRVNHYNRDFEVLLKKLELKLKNINKDEIVNYGTKEDYIDFIENAISKLENDLQEYQES